jgi:saxitoxin biosynthesis operon SxtJ-like protein
LAHGIPARLTPAEGRKFGLTVGLAFGALAAIMWWRDRPVPLYVCGGLAIGLIVAGLIIPGQLGPVYRAWMGLARVISKVTTPLFLGIVFFVVIGPVGVLMRLFGRNPIRHRAVNQSYWASPNQARGSLKNQF